MLSKGLQFACFSLAFIIVLVRATHNKTLKCCSGDRLYFILRPCHHDYLVPWLHLLLFSAWNCSERPKWRKDEQVVSHFKFLWSAFYQKYADTQTWNPYVLVYIKHFYFKNTDIFKKINAL